MPYVYLIKCRPYPDSPQQDYFLSSSSGSKSQITAHAKQRAELEHGKGRIENTYSIIKLHMSLAKYQEWRNKFGTVLRQENVDAFQSMNVDAYQSIHNKTLKKKEMGAQTIHSHSYSENPYHFDPEATATPQAHSMDRIFERVMSNALCNSPGSKSKAGILFYESCYEAEVPSPRYLGFIQNSKLKRNAPSLCLFEPPDHAYNSVASSIPIVNSNLQRDYGKQIDLEHWLSFSFHYNFEEKRFLVSFEPNKHHPKPCSAVLKWAKEASGSLTARFGHAHKPQARSSYAELHTLLASGQHREKKQQPLLPSKRATPESKAPSSPSTDSLKCFALDALNKLIHHNKQLSPKGLNLLKETFLNKDYNLLLRQSASDPNAIEVLKFLLQNAEILEVDIFAKGKKTGRDALDFAKNYANDLAIEELSPYWEPSSELTASFF